MKRPPAFQFYASDYLSSSKVQRMSLEAEGAYIRLLAYSWQDGFIPADVTQLARMCKCTPKKMASLWDEFLRDCFTPLESDPDKLINARLEQVRSGLLVFKAERSESGSKGATARWLSHNGNNGSANGSAIEQPIAKNSSPSPSPSSSPNTPIVPSGDDVYSPEFEQFWTAYPKRRSKGDAWKAWKKIKPSQALQEIILKSLEAATQSFEWRKDSGQFIPYPATWLNARGWNDDTAPLARVARMPL